MSLSNGSSRALVKDMSRLVDGCCPPHWLLSPHWLRFTWYLRFLFLQDCKGNLEYPPHPHFGQL